MPQLKDEIDKIKADRNRKNLAFRDKFSSISRLYDNFLEERLLLESFHKKLMLKYTYSDAKIRKIIEAKVEQLELIIAESDQTLFDLLQEVAAEIVFNISESIKNAARDGRREIHTEFLMEFSFHDNSLVNPISSA